MGAQELELVGSSNMDSVAVAAEIQSRLQALPSRNTPAVRGIRREFSKRLAKESPADVVDLALELLKLPGLDHRFVAYELVCHHRAALASLRAKELEQLGQGLDSWAAVDTFACFLAGPAWREQQISDQRIHRWAGSSDRWWRRAALVSTVPLNNRARGGRGDAERTLAVCQLLLDDRDDMVVKALSWALRELAKRHPQAVQEFLAEHHEQIAAQALREVRNKLTTGLKNPRR